MATQSSIAGATLAYTGVHLHSMISRRMIKSRIRSKHMKATVVENGSKQVMGSSSSNIMA